MISLNGDDDGEECFSLVNNIISRVTKEKIIATLFYDETKFPTVGRNAKKLLWVRQMLKCNMEQDVMTFVSNIFKS